MPGNDRPVDHIASDILDGKQIDWPAAEAHAADDEERGLIDELRLLSSVAEVHRPAAGSGRQQAALDAPPQYWGCLRLIEQIDERVYRAWDPRLHREVALKLIPVADASAASTIHQDRLLARVHHPGFVTIYDAEQIDTDIGLCMEFVYGQTLEQRLSQQGVFTVAETIDIGIQLCDALAAVHEAGVLHLDIRAANVVIRDDGRVVLMDFGAGRGLADAFRQDQTGIGLYLAPEVLHGQEASVRSDIYSLGVLLHHILTGAYPLQASSLPELRQAHAHRLGILGGRGRAVHPRMPRRLSVILAKATHPRPECRHATAAELRTELRKLQRHRRVAKTATWILLGTVGVALAIEARHWTNGR